MTQQGFPGLDSGAMCDTRDAMHAYARVLGAWLETTRRRRKHWWHLSLRPSLTGLTTGVVYAGIDLELELDFVGSRLRVRTREEQAVRELSGQPAGHVASWLQHKLVAMGVDRSLVPADATEGDQPLEGYSAAQAQRLHRALASVTAAMEHFRAGILEETSPIQVWPHHFDLSMIWLPGPKVPGQDPADEEHADKQMNFGFAFGDEAVPEPYLYVTAYPLPEALTKVALPAGTTWRTEGFSGAVLLYRDLIATSDPARYLQELWSTLLAAGKEHLAMNEQEGQAR